MGVSYGGRFLAENKFVFERNSVKRKLIEIHVKSFRHPLKLQQHRIHCADGSVPGGTVSWR